MVTAMYQNELLNLSTLTVPELRYFFSHQQTIPGTEKPHIHPCYEIYVNVSGNVSFLVGNHIYPITAGDVIVTRPGDVHLCIHNTAERHECFCFWFACGDDSPMTSFTRTADFSGYYRFAPDKAQQLLHLLYRLKDADARQQEPTRTACIFRLLSLFSDSAESAPASPPAPMLPEEMQGVLDYINENFPRIRSVSDITIHTHVSLSTLNRWFRSYLQISPHKLLEALRLAYAQRLLSEGCSVTDACDRAGFADCSRFISVFKQKFGVTPLQYRKQTT